MKTIKRNFVLSPLLMFLVLVTFFSCKEESVFLDKPASDPIDEVSTTETSDDESNNNEHDNEVLVTIEDTHLVKSTSHNPKVDIVWVVDNSGSMYNEQEDLANNFDQFIQGFVLKDVDFKMAITTTDPRTDGAFNGAEEFLTKEKMLEDQVSFINNFKNFIKVGVWGSGDEQGLRAMSSSVKMASQASFFRSDALLAYIIISDEQDHSVDPTNILTPVQDHVDTIVDFKGDEKQVALYTVVDSQLSKSSRYREASAMLGDFSTDIHGNFANDLKLIGDAIVNLVINYPLSQTPNDVESIVVKIDGEIVDQGQYLYEASSNTIQFKESLSLQEGQTISISYQVLVKEESQNQILVSL